MGHIVNAEPVCCCNYYTHRSNDGGNDGSWDSSNSHIWGGSSVLTWAIEAKALAIVTLGTGIAGVAVAE